MTWKFTLPGLNRPYPHWLFLALAIAAGGLRSDGGWLLFGMVFLGWFALRAEGFSAAGLRAPVMFFAWLLAAAVFSPDPAASAGIFAGYAVLGAVFFSSAAHEEGAAGWLGAVRAIGAAAAAFLLVQRAAAGPVTGFIGGNPNYSAAFCAAALPAALLAAAASGEKKRRLLNAALAVLLAAGLLASGSRGALLAAFTAACAGLYLAGFRRSMAVLMLAALAALVLLPREMLEGLFKFSDPRAFARPRLWAAALQAAAARPLLGWGPGLFERAFEIFKFPYFDGVSYFGHGTLHAHGELFNLAAEAGFPAALFFLAAAAGGLLCGGREKLPLKLGALAVFLQGSADMIFYSGAVGLLFWGSLGFAVSGGGASFAPAKRTRAALAALLLAALALAPAAGILSGQKDFLYSSYAEARSGKNKALTLALLRSVALDKPRDPFTAGAEGRALAAAGDFEGAAASFRYALALEPYYAAARVGLAGALGAAGRPGECSAELLRLEARPALSAVNDYQRALLAYDRAGLLKLKKDLCVKKKTGGATARSPKGR